MIRAMKKYKLTNETVKVNGTTLHRIKALKDFGTVKKGNLGGYIEKESNLSQYGLCWVYDDAKVLGDAQVHGDAQIFGSAQIFGDAQIFGSAYIYGNV